MDKLNEFNKLAESIRILSNKIKDFQKNPEKDEVEDVLNCVRSLMDEQIKFINSTLSPATLKKPVEPTLSETPPILTVETGNEIAKKLTEADILSNEEKDELKELYGNKPNNSSESKKTSTKKKKKERITDEQIERICQSLAKHNGNVLLTEEEVNSEGINVSSHFIREIRSKKICSEISDKYFNISDSYGGYVTEKHFKPLKPKTDAQPQKPAEPVKAVEPVKMEKPKYLPMVTTVKNGYNPYPLERMDQIIAKKKAMKMKLNIEEEEYLIKKASHELKTADLVEIFKHVKQENISMNTIKKVSDGIINNIKDYKFYKKEEVNNGN